MVIENAKYDYVNIRKLVRINIKDLEKRIAAVQAMSETEFITYVSQSIFGVAIKEYYIKQCKRQIETWKGIPQRVDYLLGLWRDEKEIFNVVIKSSYKGVVRPMKKAIEKLAQSRFNAKLVLGEN